MGDALPLAFAANQAPDLHAFTNATCGYLNGYFCWGSGAHGVFGTGSVANIGDGPAEVPVTNFPALPGLFGIGGLIRAGTEHVCAQSNGGLRCWGWNQFGQLGTGSTASWGDDPGETIATVPSEAALGSLALGATGHAHSCFTDGGPMITCWGANQAGQLGLGHTLTIGDQPGEIVGFTFTPGNFTVGHLASGIGADFTCAWNDGLGVECWGANESGQLGRGDKNNIGDEPNEIALLQNQPVSLGAGALVANVVVGRAHACARFKDGRVKCWGDNAKGQLGLGDTKNRGDDPGEMGDSLPSVPVP
jgi:alpha-tubulin suppressor-like RCC1 family protein